MLSLKRLFFFVVLSLVGIHVIAQDGKLPIFKIGIITDVQYCDAENSSTRHYRTSVNKLRDAVYQFKKSNVDFIINLGDFIDHDFSSFEPLIRIMNQVNIPVYNVLGNHDFEVGDAKREQVPNIFGLKSRYYSFTKANWRFICLDGNDISLYGNQKGSGKYEIALSMLDSLKAIKAPDAYEWNGAIGKTQVDWIKQQLQKAGKSAENIIVLCHFPIFPPNIKENLWNSDEIKDLMEQFTGKLAFFNGHTHQSNFNLNNNIFYVSFRGMVEEEGNSFAIAEVFNDSIVITGFGEEKNSKISWEKK